MLRILSGAAKAPCRPALERIRSKNMRLSAQSFTRRYDMVRVHTVTDRAPRAFKEQALGSRRAERAKAEKADHSEQANQTPSQLACAWCARCVFFCARRGPLKKSCGATRARSLCFINTISTLLGWHTAGTQPALFTRTTKRYLTIFPRFEFHFSSRFGFKRQV